MLDKTVGEVLCKSVCFGAGSQVVASVSLARASSRVVAEVALERLLTRWRASHAGTVVGSSKLLAKYKAKVPLKSSTRIFGMG